MSSSIFPCVIPFYYTLLNFFTYLFCFLYFGLLGLLPTSGEHFKSTAPLEIYLMRKMLTCSILILPTVYIYTTIQKFGVSKIYFLKYINIFTSQGNITLMKKVTIERFTMFQKVSI